MYYDAFYELYGYYEYKERKNMPLTDEAKLARALVRAASPTGKESPAAEVMCAAFRELGFDETSVDDAGNVIGIFRRGDGPTVMLNGHLDTVPVGDPELWPHPPLSGEVEGGRLWGRGACDMKSALACMAYAAKDAVEADVKGTLMVTAVVQEEVGGLGARYLSETVKADVVILGEPSKLRLMLGHRGRVEVHARLPGRIAHAAKNELGDNALYHAADFLRELKNLDLPAGGPLGGSSLTPTRLTSYPPDGANVVPGRADLVIDYRNIPGDERDEIVSRLSALAPEGTVLEVPEHTLESENGRVVCTLPRSVPAYLAPGENPWVERARRVLKPLFAEAGHPFAEACWWFATDAPHLAQTGAVIIGLGPGEEELAHTTRESVPLEHLPLARKAYAALARDFLTREARA